MNKRKDIMDEFYSNHNEDVRLIKSYHGQLEYFTTITYESFRNWGRNRKIFS